MTDRPDHRSRRRAVGTGVAVGVCALLVAGAAFGVALLVGGGDETVESLTAETARAGQCVDITEDAGRVSITEVGCGVPHDAEIVLTTEVGDAIAEPAELDDFEGVCSGLMEPDDVARLGDVDGGLEWGLLIDEPSNVDGFDRLVCYVRSPEGPLTEPLLG